MQIHYYLWQIQAYFVAKRLHQKIEFDIAHHVTFVKYSSPSFLSLLPIPFVWGSVGGAETAPKTFWQDFNLKNKIYETLRLLVRWIGEQDPFTRLTARRNAITYTTTKDTAKRVTQLGASCVKIASETALSKSEINYLAQLPPPNTNPFRFVSIARLLHWKGMYLGLKAFAKANLFNAEYWIVGDGPEMKKLQKIAQDLAISNSVKFWGKLPRDEVLLKLGQCSALVHPSLHDSGGWVCLEAMAARRPVICLNLGGPAEQVTSETGFQVSADNPDQCINDMAEVMKELVKDKKLLLQMGKSGQKRVMELYNWEVKGKEFAQIYQQLGCSK